jgi:hypothetical protein
MTCGGYLYLSLILTATAQTRRASKPAILPSKVNTAGRQSARQALIRLQALRDGWNNVNRAYIVRDFEFGQKLNPEAYEILYLEAQAAISEAMHGLPKGELRLALLQAIELFDDLEKLGKIFETKSPLSTTVYISDVFPFIKKYQIPYEGGIEKGALGFKLHKDFVLSYILPQRYSLVNRVEVLLGGKLEPVPPPPTYEQMHRVPPQKPQLDRTRVKADELKEHAHQALKAKLRGDRVLMDALLDDAFRLYGREGLLLDKQMYLGKMAADQTVKSFEIEGVELSFWNDKPTLVTVVKYESVRGQSKRFRNTFTFVNKGGRWLIITWRTG